MATQRRSGTAQIRGRSAGRGDSPRLTGDLQLADVSRHAHVTAMQRSRLLAAAAGSVAELGWEGATIGSIAERAGVSRRTFYELFENRDRCLIAVLESATAQIATEIASAGLADLSWRERIRGGLRTILCFFDRRPALARVCLVESRRGGGIALDYRQQVVENLIAIVDQGRGESSRASEPAMLTAHGVVGGIFEVLYSQLLKNDGAPLRDLLGELTGMVVLPYLGAAAARREQSRPAPELRPDDRAERVTEVAEVSDRDLMATLPMRLTYRTARVLQVLEEGPGQSNRQVAKLVGISDQGQISKLLSRLARLGLLSNTAARGERNQWVLTVTGSQVARSIKSYVQSAQHETGHVINGGVEHAF